MPNRIPTADNISTLKMPDSARKLHVDFRPDRLNLTAAGATAVLNIKMPDIPGAESAILTIDAYLLDNPVHPQGHFGWWSFSIDANRKFALEFAFRDGCLAVSSKTEEISDRWVNMDEPDVSASQSILVHVVLRHGINNSILSQQSLVAFRDDTALKHAVKQARAYLPAVRRDQDLLAKHNFNWPSESRLHIVAGALPRPQQLAGDLHAVALARELAANGVPCSLYATEFDSKLRGVVRNTRELLGKIQPSDIVVLFYEDRELNLPWLSELQCRKAFICLDIPRSPRLQAFDAQAHRNHQAAWLEMPAAKMFDIVAANSDVLAKEVAAAVFPDGKRDVVVMDFIDRTTFWDEIATNPFTQFAGPVLLCPARLEPNNGFVKTLQLFEKLLAIRPDAQLLAASNRPRHVYFKYIESLLATRFSGIQKNVSLRLDIDDADLKGMMQACAAMIDLSDTANQHLTDAEIFEKPLFTRGGPANTQASSQCNFRLFGTDQDKAEALVQFLKRPAAFKPAGREIHHREPARPGLLNLLEDLIALPGPLNGSAF